MFAISDFMTFLLIGLASSYAAAAVFAGCLFARAQSQHDRLAHKAAEKPRGQAFAQGFDDAQDALLQKWRRKLTFPSFEGFEFQRDTSLRLGI
jgi:hypothetical protein